MTKVEYENFHDGTPNHVMFTNVPSVSTRRVGKEDPYLDAHVRGWIVKYAHKQYWKVQSWYDFEDLVQDGYLCFAKARKGFKFTMDEPTHDNRKEFMAFFQMAFVNHIIDLQKDPRCRLQELAVAALSDDQAEAVESWAEKAADLGNASLSLMLAKAPAEILDMLKSILVDCVADGPYTKSRLHKQGDRLVKGRRLIRETTEEHYDRCLGQTGVVAKLRQYFLGEEAELV